jgi:hypothetical protein
VEIKSRKRAPCTHDAVLAGFYARLLALIRSDQRKRLDLLPSPPASGFPAPKPLTLKKKAKWSYYQNVCTQSYSMWWYAWEDWERNLDWAALWGVNLVLAYTGQEKIFRDVFNGIGVNDSVLNNTFDGPAFLTWSRGQGTFGVGGPLPNYWIESQYALQIKIMDRLRELGMYGVLPGFQGNVPKEMPELFPHANTSNGWLDALDPLFDTIGHGVGSSMQADFGPASFVEADGWFSLETGPWLSSEAAIAYHEDAVLALASGASTEEVLAATFGLDLRDTSDSGGCLGNFVIPTEEEAFTRAQAVFSSLVKAKPDATWIYQGMSRYCATAARLSQNSGACGRLICIATDCSLRQSYCRSLFARISVVQSAFARRLVQSNCVALVHQRVHSRNPEG